MKMTGRRLSPLLLVTSLILCSCNGGETHAPGPAPPAGPYLPNTSVDNVIANLRTAFKRAEIQPYEGLLAEEYEFVFDSSDVVRLGTPAAWDRDQDVLVMQRLFGDSTDVNGRAVCDTIRVDLFPGTPDTVSSPGLTKVSVWLVMEVPTRDRETHQRISYIAENVYEHLYLRRTGSNWEVVRWVEESFPMKSPATSNGTIGAIKWYWRS